ncbi:MAG: NUDIX domain-containing protein [Phycisphaerales bacterium]
MNPVMPTFGTRNPARSYTPRESVYAIITDAAGLFAAVSTPTGLWLPGGGLEPGETHESALRRELHEECGAAAQLTPTSLRAIEFVDAGHEGHFEKRCQFFRATFLAPPAAPIHWLTRAQAAAQLKPAAHRWAVAQLP